MAVTWGAPFIVPSPPSGFSFTSIVWASALGEWWACGSGPGVGTTTNLLYKSTDGVTWVNVDPGFQKNYLTIAWSEDLGQLCALSNLSFTGGTSTHVITTSDDGGATWLEHDIPDGAGATAANNSQFRGLCWGNGQWVAVAQVTSNAHQVMTSPDGFVWANRVAAAARSWNTVLWSPSLALFVAFGGTNSQSDNVMTSSDGVNWFSQTTPVNVRFVAGNTRMAAWGNGLLAAFGDVNNGATSADRAHLFTSVNASVWTETLDAGMLANSGWTSLVWADAQWVAISGASGPSPNFARSATSFDALSWTQVPDPSGVIDFSWKCIAWSGSQLAVVESGTHIVTGVLPFSVTSITPNSGTDLGGDAVTIVGEGFTGVTRVNFDNLEATSIVIVDDNTITCVTPAHAAGIVDLTVTKGASGALAQLLAAFTFIESGFDPASGGGAGLSPDHGTMLGGTAVTITGRQLAAGYNIYFGGTLATSIVHVNDTEYTCVTPAHTAGAVDVVVGPYSVAAAYTFDELSAAEYSGEIRREPAVSTRETGHVSSDFNFSTGDTLAPVPGKDISVDFGDGPVFDGTILENETTYEERTDQLVHNASTVDFVWQLNSRRPFGSWIDTSVTTIANYLIATFAPDFTSTGVASSLPNVDITFDGSLDFAGCLIALVNAMGVGGGWYLDLKDLHLFQDPEGGAIDPDKIVDDTATFLKNPPIKIIEDVSQVRNHVFGRGAGASSVTDTPAGAGVIEISSLDAFETSGGLAIIGSNVFSYTGKGRVSEVIYRATAPSASGGGMTITNELLGVIQGGEIRDFCFYKVSFIDAAGKESNLSGSISPTYGIPNNPMNGFGAVSALGITGGGNIDAGQYAYVIGAQGPAGSSNGANFQEGNAFYVNVTVGSGGAKVAFHIPDFTPFANDPRLTTIKVYRNKNGGSQWYEVGSFVNVWPGGTGHDFTDVLNDASLSGPNADIYTLPSSPRSPLCRNTFGTTNFLALIPLGPAGTTARKIYRSQGFNQPEVYSVLTTLPDNTTTTYTDNSATRVPAFGDFPDVTNIANNVQDGAPAPLPPVIHLVLTGVSGIVTSVKSGAPVNVWAQADDLDAQIVMAGRRGGNGVREFTVIDTSLRTPELQTRVNAELTLWSMPITKVIYATRDAKHKPNRTASFDLVNPPLVGSFLIQEVSVSQIDEADGLDPMRLCTASSVRFTLDDLLRHVKLDNDGSSTSAGSLSAGGSQGSGGDSGVSPHILSVADDGHVTLEVSSGAAAALLADTTLTAKLSDTGVAAAAYTNVNVTVDAQGRITAIASGPVETNGPAGAINNDIAVYDGVTGKLLKDGGSTIAAVIAAAVAASGDVKGPAGATNLDVAIYDGVTGKLIKDSGVTITAIIAAAIAGSGTVITTGAPASGNLAKFSGAASITNGDLSGDVATAGTLVATIQPDTVTNAKAANMAQSTIKGRAAGAGTGDPTDLTAAQATAILDNVVGDSGAGGTKGLVPAPAAGDAAASKFLKADGTWVAVSASGASIAKVRARIILGV